MAGKRGNNDGSVYMRKDGRWEARVTVGYRPDGRPRRKSIYGATQAEVQTKMKELQVQVDRGAFIDAPDITVGQWLQTWYSAYGVPRWRPKTALAHDDNMRLHLIPSLGRIKLSKLRVDHVQSFINAQQEKGLSPATIRKQLAPLKGALRQAVENGLLMRSVVDSVKLPKMEGKEIAFLSPEEQKLLLAELPDSSNGRAIRFILASGLRASELCGLRWCDIEEDSFTVRQGAQYIRTRKGAKQQLVIAPPKTKAGRRTIPLTGSMKEILNDHKVKQMQHRLAMGEGWIGGTPGKGDTPVFASEAGTVLDKNNLSRTLRLTLERLHLPNRGLHALRHTFATNWVRSGADLRTLAEILGHTNVAFTMQQYVHTDMATKLAGMEAVEAAQMKA